MSADAAVADRVGEGERPKTLTRAHLAVLATCAAIVGVVAWAGPFGLLALAFLVPVLWSAASDRWSAAFVVLCYYLGATWAMPYGATVYFRGPWYVGAAYWFLGAAVPMLPWLALWRPTKSGRALVLPLIFVIAAVPPIGIVGWAHPVTAAGVVFPAMGWFGLGLALALGSGLILISRRAAVALVAVLPLLALVGPQPRPPPGWIERQTEFSFGAGERDYAADYQRIVAIKQELPEIQADVVVYGESLAGRWNQTGAEEWANRAMSARIVLIGADYPLEKESDNVIMALTPEGDSVLYRQRLPMPVSLWRPWSGSGVRAHWLENPVVDVAGRRVAPLLCYEVLLVWPVLHSLASGADTIVAMSNLWWCQRTSVATSERKAVLAWGRLFGVSLVVAVNGG